MTVKRRSTNDVRVFIVLLKEFFFWWTEELKKNVILNRIAGVALGKCACSLLAGARQRTYISYFALFFSAFFVYWSNEQDSLIKITCHFQRVQFFLILLFLTHKSPRNTTTHNINVLLSNKSICYCAFGFSVGCCFVLLANRINVSKIITQSYS